jgi:hypothetical protein
VPADKRGIPCSEVQEALKVKIEGGIGMLVLKLTTRPGCT